MANNLPVVLLQQLDHDSFKNNIKKVNFNGEYTNAERLVGNCEFVIYVLCIVYE